MMKLSDLFAWMTIAAILLFGLGCWLRNAFGATTSFLLIFACIFISNELGRRGD